MYKFQGNADFSYLENCTLTQIVVDRYQLSLVFSEMYRIVAEHCLEYTQATTGEKYRYLIQPGAGPIVFNEILEQKVIAVVSDEWKFTMTFEGGGQISVFTEEGPYESGHILSPSGGHFIF